MCMGMWGGGVTPCEPGGVPCCLPRKGVCFGVSPHLRVSVTHCGEV